MQLLPTNGFTQRLNYNAAKVMAWQLQRGSNLSPKESELMSRRQLYKRDLINMLGYAHSRRAH